MDCSNGKKNLTSCLFCTCSTLEKGTVQVKKEVFSTPDHDDEDHLPQSVSAVEEDESVASLFVSSPDAAIGVELTTFFVVKNILKIPEKSLVEYLQLETPHRWFSLCSVCQDSVRRCLQTVQQISKLQSQLLKEETKLIEKIRRTKSATVAESPIWHNIRYLAANESNDGLGIFQSQSDNQMDSNSCHEEANIEVEHELNSENEEGIQEREGRYKCAHCPFSTDDKEHLKTHAISHLGGHQMERATTNRKVRCSPPSTLTPSKGRQRPSKSGSHQVDASAARFKCLKLPQRRRPGKRPFGCSWEGCGWSFARKGELTRHSLLHTGERPYICKTCCMSFNRKDSLNKHAKRHKT
ncbi:Krueppel-like factor 1 [Orchesella cincta]|uniref:Krueppel-like factor 1 n=1 Tax=Orchesella cincta TaxID=48709 RepID=A0A1D2M4Q0_ORCCI|nr:Krueppel-like factor 1 [Orchesella cincta]